MDIEDLKDGPKVRVKIFLDGLVAVLRFRLLDGKLVKECLSNSGDWVVIPEFQEYLKIEDVVRQVSLLSDL